LSNASLDKKTCFSYGSRESNLCSWEKKDECWLFYKRSHVL